uniref:Uncharacterized protein n=1 Tax=Myotis myotis TaxID=51298 RepID=A0A7J7TTN1_MYOMY|nr:hypothetical protein mMyoMyo1_008935 [Myotis myotis]
MQQKPANVHVRGGRVSTCKASETLTRELSPIKSQWQQQRPTEAKTRGQTVWFPPPSPPQGRTGGRRERPEDRLDSCGKRREEGGFLRNCLRLGAAPRKPWLGHWGAPDRACPSSTPAVPVTAQEGLVSAWMLHRVYSGCLLTWGRPGGCPLPTHLVAGSLAGRSSDLGGQSFLRALANLSTPAPIQTS